MNAQSLRIGHGFDVHKFAESFDSAKPLILAGVELQESMSLLAHSDGDVVLHALSDAILGALGQGDIGELFPDTDPSIAGIASTKILARVVEMMVAEKGTIVNLDITVVAQKPRLSQYRQRLCESLSLLLDLDLSRVNVKATTTEKMGYIGRGEGIACHSIVLIELQT